MPLGWTSGGVRTVRRPGKAEQKQRSTELLSRKEAADYLGVSENTLAIWNSTGRYRLPVVKVGRLAKYRVSDLEHFINRRTMSWDEPDAEEKSSRKIEIEKTGIEFREVHVVDENKPRRGVRTPNGGLELVLPSGITLRLPEGYSPDSLSSVLSALEMS